MMADLLHTSFQIGIGVMHDASARLPEELAVTHPHAADGDARIKVHAVLVQTKPANAARVGATRAAFHLADDFHCTHLGRAGNRTRREGGRQHVQSVQPFLKAGADPAGEVHDVRVTLNFHVALQIHRSGLGHAAKVVAAKVNQHDMLGTFLGVVP